MVAGPTAAGKTAVAVELALHYGISVISADSRQFYREMNAGTAKPAAEQLARVNHHFINSKSIHELYGSGHYERDALKVIAEEHKHSRFALICGGSGLYINAVLYGLDDFEEVPEEMRNEIRTLYESDGLDALVKEIEQKDPDFLKKADTRNPQRLMRALEVIRQTGRPFSERLRRQKAERPFEAIKLMINLPRKDLYERINDRVKGMMANGLLEEARALYPYRKLNALRTVGYSEMFAHLEGQLTLEEAMSEIQKNTRRYAKRQLTWFRNQDDYEVFSPDELPRMINYIDTVSA